MLIYIDFIVLTLWELSVTVNQVVCLLELDFVSNSEKIILKMSQVRLDDRCNRWIWFQVTWQYVVTSHAQLSPYLKVFF